MQMPPIISEHNNFSFFVFLIQNDSLRYITLNLHRRQMLSLCKTSYGRPLRKADIEANTPLELYNFSASKRRVNKYLRLI